ncbi:LSU ribosomal protein L5P [Isosphaera pallida ATCC 43644]|jgi:large subunit ribosomal protein L5|uniref:Large ribosomal subunit protein uL5 n=1 Tax=Isosphaera pallida (strain ATCC 43644 / DSM 9630 / IS1B) TaxID=575540 RepID=E8R3T6_ISOPI|nr:50S ribosomal protein L5 [Isosphaera pallida]ADV62671.1 LSU ribosomal protein L5P [Isosphaera pallida ATCC 43644]
MARATPSAPAATAKAPASNRPARLQALYHTTIAPELKAKYQISNPMAVPRLEKIVINMGVGRATQDKAILESAVETLSKISGQKPLICKAKVSVSQFRLREGNNIGCKVTLRGKRMYEFLDRLVTLALPRIRDFRGVNPNSFDGNGNYSLGLTEQVVFPEIEADKIVHTHGMDITLVTNVSNDDQARELLRALGMPFRKPVVRKPQPVEPSNN